MKRSTKDIEYSHEASVLAKYAKALAHPVRTVILKHLDSRSCCYTGDLVEVLPMAQSTISQHLKELKTAGLIIGEVDPPKVRYCINEESWSEAKSLFSSLFDQDFKNISCC